MKIGEAQNFAGSMNKIKPKDAVKTWISIYNTYSQFVISDKLGWNFKGRMIVETLDLPNYLQEEMENMVNVLQIADIL